MYLNKKGTFDFLKYILFVFDSDTITYIINPALNTTFNTWESQVSVVINNNNTCLDNAWIAVIS